MSAVVGGGVGLALLGRELVELVALAGDAHARDLVGEVDLVAVPAQLPGDDDVDDAAAGVADGSTETSGRPSERAMPATVRGCSESLNSVDRRGDLVLDAGRHGADVARLAARAPRSRARRGSPAPSRLARRRGSRAGRGPAPAGSRAGADGAVRCASSTPAAMRDRRPVLVEARGVVGRRQLIAPAAQAAEQRAAAVDAGRRDPRSRGPCPRAPSRRAAPARCTARTPSGGCRR